jgi:hypothetical protein
LIRTLESGVNTLPFGKTNGDIQVNEDGSKTMNDKDQKPCLRQWIR